MGHKFVLLVAVTSVLCAVVWIAGYQVPNVAAEEGQTPMTAPSPAQGLHRSRAGAGSGDSVSHLRIYRTECSSFASRIHCCQKLTRTQVPLKSWNANWHDHTIEIAGGRVQVLDMPADKAKGVADLVSTTDGLIVHFYYDGNLPNGRTSIAQAVGHKPMKETEFKSYAAK